MKLYYLCIYSELAHEYLYHKSVAEDERVLNTKGEEYDSRPLWQYDSARYALQCTNVGGDWQVWCEEEPFSWAALEAKKHPVVDTPELKTAEDQQTTVVQEE